jgi:stage III sporulation protein AA
MPYGTLIAKTLFPLLAPAIAAVLRAAPPELLAQAGEVRLRAGKPLIVVTGGGDTFLDARGQPAGPGDAFIAGSDDVAKTLQLISRNSLYACEEELRQGFLTVAGGHRIGIAGQAVMAGGELKTLKNISALNIRLAREIRGAADAVMPYAVSGARVLNSLVISPPRCGKTTVLRDMARQLSSGIGRLGFAGVQVGIVDERSELAACQDGLPTADLGPRADVLDGCPKAVGMLMLIRSMAPQVIVTDELGREADAAAVREASHAGVAVVASAHGRDVADIAARPFLGELIAERIFERFIILGDTPSVGTVQLIAAGGGEAIYCRPGGVRACG